MNKRRVQVVPPGGAIVGLDGVRWEGRLLVTGRCGHQFSTSSRPSLDLCISTERLLDNHERLCSPLVPGLTVRQPVFDVTA